MPQTVQLYNPIELNRSAVYVQSNTLVGDYHHPRGVVVTHIVKANIPVRNGVIHLIEKPLVVIDSDIVNFLKVTVIPFSHCHKAN